MNTTHTPPSWSKRCRRYYRVGPSGMWVFVSTALAVGEWKTWGFMASLAVVVIENEAGQALAAAIETAESAPRAARHEVGTLLKRPAAHRNTVPSWASRQDERNLANARRRLRTKAQKNTRTKAAAVRWFG